MAVISGVEITYGWPMTTVPPIGQTVNGQGGVVTGAGSPR